jgi:hypothetical protein
MEVYVFFHKSCHEFVVVVVALFPLKLKVKLAFSSGLDNFIGV